MATSGSKRQKNRRQTSPLNETNWRQYITEWQQIGPQLRLAFTRQALPQSELQFVANLGYRFGDHLGFGTYGTVWQCFAKDRSGRDREMACKVINLDRYRQEQYDLFDAVTLMLNESNVLEDLHHPNILCPERVIKIADPETGFPFIRLLLVMELCAGDVHQLMATSSGRKLAEQQARDVMLDVCQGVKYLHEQNVIHMDIKPTNILYTIDPNGKHCYKLADFGYSIRYPTGMTPTIGTGMCTEAFRAPELQRSESSDPRKADIYSLGTSLVYMLVGRDDTIDCREEIWSVSDSSSVHSFVSKWSISVAVLDLTAKMVRVEHKSRPDINQVLNHCWIRGIAPESGDLDIADDTEDLDHGSGCKCFTCIIS